MGCGRGFRRAPSSGSRAFPSTAHGRLVARHLLQSL
uniref:Uncharacterized protein n=1 Tax=Human herpesvirus 1 TaxID=10298 RepID=A0A2Z4H861_HHV1|nr:hypothetical protein [Human alphaherpesvirus 1]